jgi:hypothetical protein
MVGSNFSSLSIVKPDIIEMGHCSLPPLCRTASWPVNGESGSGLGVSSPLVSFMQTTEHCGLKAGNKELAAIHYNIVINAKMVFGSPKISSVNLAKKTSHLKIPL